MTQNVLEPVNLLGEIKNLENTRYMVQLQKLSENFQIIWPIFFTYMFFRLPYIALKVSGIVKCHINLNFEYGFMFKNLYQKDWVCEK